MSAAPLKTTSFRTLATAVVTVSAAFGLANSTHADGKRGAGTPPEYFFGMPHTAMGSATFGVDPLGRLSLDNLGSSGQDGVSISLGQATGCAIECVSPPSGGWPDAASLQVSIQGFVVNSHTSAFDLILVGRPDGLVDVSVASDAHAGQCVTTTLFRDGLEIHRSTRVLPVNDPPTLLFACNVGSDAVGRGFIFEGVTESLSTKSSIFCPNSGVWFVVLPELPTPLECDHIELSLDGLPPGEPVIGTLRVTGSNLPNGSVTIAGEYLRDRPRGWDGLIYGNHRAVGSAHIAGITNPDICAGCPECCDPSLSDPLERIGGVHVSNIGSSGLDGATFECRPWGSPWFVSDLRFACSPIELSDDLDMCRLSAFGTFNGLPGRSLGECGLRNNVGKIELLADFAALGSQQVTIECQLNGALVGGDNTQGGQGVVIGSLVPGGPGGGPNVRVSGCGKLGGTTPCYVWELEEPTAFMTNGGIVIVCDEIRVLASGATGPITTVDAFTVRGRSIDDFTLLHRDFTVDASPPDIMYAGSMHSAVGDAELSVADLDGDGRPDLAISNIGSSGQDGVSVDLHRAQGASFTFDTQVFATYGGLSFDIYDDQCPTCPGGLLSRSTITPSIAGTYVFELSVVDAISTDLHFYDEDGLLLGTRTIMPGQSVTLTEPPGEPLALKTIEKTTAKLYEGSRRTYVFPHVLEVSGSISVTAPGTPPVQNVHRIECCTSSSFDTNIPLTATRACVTATASGVCDPCTLTIVRSSVILHDHAHTGLGQARMVADNNCDDADPGSDPFLYITNIGSSGQDGVSIALRPGPGEDDDCDGTADDDLCVTGATISFQNGGVTMEDDWETPVLGRVGGGGGGAGGLVELFRTTLDKATPQLYQVVCSGYSWMPSPNVTIVVRDRFGNTVDSRVALALPGLCSLSTSRLPTSSTVTLHGSSSSSTHLESVSFTYHKIEWDYSSADGRGDEPVVFHLTNPPADVSGSSLEIYVEPSSGNPVQTALSLDSVDFYIKLPDVPGESIAIVDEQIHTLADQCQADLAPDGLINVFDLFVLLSNWNTAGDGAALATPRNLVDVFDLFVMLSRWGFCNN